MDFANTLFRCSSCGHLMTEPRSKAEKAAGGLSESAKTNLIDIYVSNKYDRQTEVQNKFVEKGLLVEEDSITLYSRVKKQFFKKNEEHLSNDYIKGTPDLFVGETIRNAERIIDIKSSWDIFTFFRVKGKPMNNLYYWQLQGYMALTGAKKATLAYCLINTPEQIINDEKRKLMWKMGVATELNPEYLQACEQLDKLMRYDDIPMENRVIEFEVERNDIGIAELYDKVKAGRLFLAEFDAQFELVA